MANEVYTSLIDKNGNCKIPEGMKIIANNAFENCADLRNIELPDSVTSIGEKAFAGCTNLASVKMSENVNVIGAGAFEKCTSLAQMKVPDSVATIGDNAFSGCTGLRQITLPDELANNKQRVEYLLQKGSNYPLTYSGNNCGPNGSSSSNDYFYPCYLKFNLDYFSLTKSIYGIGLPNTCRVIKSGELKRTAEIQKMTKRVEQLEDVLKTKGIELPNVEDLPPSKKQFDELKAQLKVKDDELKQMNEKVKQLEQMLNEQKTKMSEIMDMFIVNNANKPEKSPVQPAPASTQPEQQYIVDGKGDLILPPNMKEIKAEQFANRDDIKTVKIPYKIKFIGDKAFYNCKNLEHVVIRDSVNQIGKSVFLNCNNLKHIIITPKLYENLGELGITSKCKIDFYDKNHTNKSQRGQGGTLQNGGNYQQGILGSNINGVYGGAGYGVDTADNHGSMISDISQNQTPNIQRTDFNGLHNDVNGDWQTVNLPVPQQRQNMPNPGQYYNPFSK